MLIDATHKRWAVATGLLFVIASGAYVPYHLSALNGATGGSIPGLVYGFLGTAMILFAALIGFRRKFPRIQIGRASTWLKGHIWLGLLSYPVILFHSGFHLGGPLTTVLMILFTVVIITGIHGLIMQTLVPRFITMQVPLETVYDQIDHVSAQLLKEAEAEVVAVCGAIGGTAAAAVAAPQEHGDAKPKAKKKEPQAVPGSGRLRDFFLQEIKPYLDGKVLAPRAFSTGSRRGARFEQVRVLIPPSIHSTLALLEEICEERRQLLHERSLHHWLHGWVFVHLPASAALVVLSLVHAVVSLYY